MLTGLAIYALALFEFPVPLFLCAGSCAVRFLQERKKEGPSIHGGPGIQRSCMQFGHLSGYFCIHHT